MSIRAFCLLAVVGLLLVLPSRPNVGAQDKPAAKAETELEKKLEAIEKKLAELTAALQKAPPRYQALNAGTKVVIVDTVTGTYKTIEPGDTPRYAAFAVGRSVISVNLFSGTINEREGAK